MAKSSTRRVTIYVNGKEVEASVKQIRSEMNKLVNEQNRMDGNVQQGAAVRYGHRRHHAESLLS